MGTQKDTDLYDFRRCKTFKILSLYQKMLYYVKRSAFFIKIILRSAFLCATMIYDIWADIDSGKLSLNGTGYAIDDWWNLCKIPDGSYRHENTHGLVGYKVNGGD